MYMGTILMYVNNLSPHSGYGDIGWFTAIIPLAPRPVNNYNVGAGLSPI
jgi:hypothetical protein